MNLKSYLKDKKISILLFLFVYLVILLMLFAFKTPSALIKAVSLILPLCGILLILINYFPKKKFYNELLTKVELLDKSYLVLEVIKEPDFYEGKLLYQTLYDINKSMNEFVKTLEFQMTDFKEYIEMWIHEVKIPLASLILMAHNNTNEKLPTEQINRIEDYLDQVLYYVRSENAEKDYLINEINLNKVIGNVALKNKDYLLENNIDLIVKDVDYKILTDSKWLEFIINQIINNSIKYRKPKVKSYIKITTKEEKDKVTLIIEDNGIGIPSTDISRVFEKSFTGHNGRIRAKSTGMGLFIAKKLCNKIGHKITIESVENKYTKVYITFSKNKFYEVVK